MNFKELSVTHPNAGETKWQAGIDPKLAEQIADHYWDVCGLAWQDGVCNIKSRAGYVAMVGLVGGVPALLNKDPDGSRTLIKLEVQP